MCPSYELLTSVIDKPKIVVVDDERPARSLLRLMLAKQKCFVHVAECATGADAIRTIEHEKPDVVILDIRLPDMTGFDVVNKLRYLPHIIFSTAYDAFAVHAFNINAVDYLLKPYDQKRLTVALKRAYFRIQTGRKPKVKNMAGAFAVNNFMAPNNERLTVREKGQLHYLKFDEIAWIRAMDDYICIYLNDNSSFRGKNKFLVKERLMNIERLLDPTVFLRIHRSAIVNRNSIATVKLRSVGEPRVILHGGVELRVARRRLPLLKALLMKDQG
jgi:two-component system LytT family response regulator